MHILDYLTTAEYMKLHYGNRAPRRWWGDAHRAWLLSSGRYIKTSEQRAIGLMQLISGPLPEYAPSQHKGAALWMPSEPGSRHWPGCGCP